MENIVYSKSEFFDSINSSYKSVLKKKQTLQPIMNNEKTLLRGDLEIRQTRARDSFKPVRHILLLPFPVPAPFSAEVGARAAAVPRWGNGDKQAWDTQTQPSWDLLCQTPFPQGWKTNGLITQNAVLFASAKLTLHSASLRYLPQAPGKMLNKQRSRLGRPGLALYCLLFIIRLILLCHMVKNWSLASKIAVGRQEKLVCICLQVSSINEYTDAALKENAREKRSPNFVPIMWFSGNEKFGHCSHALIRGLAVLQYLCEVLD